MVSPDCRIKAPVSGKFLAFMSVLIFLSGAAGLLYEVLWMKQLGYLFGNSAHASAATLSAFFLGMGAGSAWWGRRSANMHNLLRAYALLETGIFVCALLYFPLLQLFQLIYPALFKTGSQLHLGLGVTCFLAMLLVCPATFFMGGTLPVLGQLLIQRRDEFGRKAALFYGINTIGAATGAFLAGFYLPPLLGYHLSYVIALSTTAVVILAAGVLASRRAHVPPTTPRDTVISGSDSKSLRLGMPAVLGLCFLSGFGALAMEVLWTQMFSLVFQNTVYTFAAILVVTLICMALGACAANMLARGSWPPVKVLLLLFMATGVAIAFSSFHLVNITDNLKLVGSREGWGDYTLRVFGLTFAVAGLPLFLSGIIFPYLLKASEQYVTSAGQALGKLSAINTLGAILGPMLAGFVFLKWLGLWHSIQLFGILYLLAAIFVPVSLKTVGFIWRGAALALALVLIFVFDPGGFLQLRVEPGEQIVEYWHGPGGTVAVVRKGKYLNINVNGHYGLGSTEADFLEKDQTTIPLLLHPRAKSIFFLGLGTGITAGEAMSSQYGLERVVACELSAEVVTAVRKYFGEYTQDLFNDPRSTVIVDDGRHYLFATRERFDIIDSDLFLVYERGAGSLYTLEHFQNAARHLKPGGIFVQWIPLYQLTRPEFCVIARTMLQVFPQVTVWRDHFKPWQDVVALVGQDDKVPLFGPGYQGPDHETRVKALDFIEKGRLRPDSTTLLLYYCGNLTGAKDSFKDSPLNTEDHPLIEYMAPRSSSMQAADKVAWFAGPHFVSFMKEMQTCTPPEEDPALAGLALRERLAAKAGNYLARSYLLYNAFQRKVPGANESWLKLAEQDRQAFLKYWVGEEPLSD